MAMLRLVVLSVFWIGPRLFVPVCGFGGVVWGRANVMNVV